MDALTAHRLAGDGHHAWQLGKALLEPRAALPASENSLRRGAGRQQSEQAGRSRAEEVSGGNRHGEPGSVPLVDWAGGHSCRGVHRGGRQYNGLRRACLFMRARAAVQIDNKVLHRLCNDLNAAMVSALSHPTIQAPEVPLNTL